MFETVVMHVFWVAVKKQFLILGKTYCGKPSSIDTFVYVRNESEYLSSYNLLFSLLFFIRRRRRGFKSTFWLSSPNFNLNLIINFHEVYCECYTTGRYKNSVIFKFNLTNKNVGGDSSAGIATRYVLDGLGSSPGGGEIFRTRSDLPWCPRGLLCNGYRVFPGVKWPGCGVVHPPDLAPRLKKE